MKAIKQWIPIGLLGLSFFVAAFIVVNSQFLFGGYEGMLYKSLEPILSGEPIEIEGEIHLAPGGSDTADLMAMTFILHGHLDRQNMDSHLHLDLLQPGSTEAYPIGEIYQTDDGLFLLTETEEPVFLTDIPSAKNDDQDIELWNDFYGALAVEEVMGYSRVGGLQTVKTEMVIYQMSLSDLLGQIERQGLEQRAVESEVTQGSVDILVDSMGRLSAIEFEGVYGGVLLSGWFGLGE